VRLAQPEVRQQPKLIAADGSQNSFFGRGVDQFPGSYWFYGTSAAAPNAAAVGALVLQAAKKTLTPAALEALLMQTAQDVDDPFDQGVQTNPLDPRFTRGYDLASGAGLVQAEPAVERVRTQLGTANLRISPVCARADEQVWFVQNPNGFGVETLVSVTGAAFRFADEAMPGVGPRSRVIAPDGEYLYTAAPVVSLPLSVELRWTSYPATSTPVVKATKRGGWSACV
jgi:subtilisin family serine protease